MLELEGVWNCLVMVLHLSMSSVSQGWEGENVKGAQTSVTNPTGCWLQQQRLTPHGSGSWKPVGLASPELFLLTCGWLRLSSVHMHPWFLEVCIA